MFGNIVNVIAIITGSIIGMLLKKGIPERIQNVIITSLGMSVIVMGLKDGLTFENPLFMVGCILIGALIGEGANLQDKITRLGEYLQHKFAKDNDNDIVTGFVITSLMFNVGAMAIIGPMKSGLDGNHQILFVKSLLDFTFSIIYATKYGIGVTFSAATVFIYQGLMWGLSTVLKDALSEIVVSQINSIGGVLLMGLGINQVFKKDLKLLNMVPALFIPIIVKLAEPLINCINPLIIYVKNIF
ncbi:DUF554 domain-containing protein [Fusobacterium sp. PH5-44]|uniref:DUF554 domain-containing protein n=1 Tax=unclassified Fusobacterium TaxID=2648384 RepID=UPI003D19966A